MGYRSTEWKQGTSEVEQVMNDGRGERAEKNGLEMDIFWDYSS